MEEKSNRYQQIEETEGVKITPSKSSEPVALTRGKVHIVASDETLSHIALRYYGSAAKEKWMIIYEANKEFIGENPNIIRKGMELFVPDIDE
jgi:nucleoid-associated protein YgaU